MGKKDKTSVGRAILKDRSKGGNLGKGKQSWLHTSDLNDGEDWSRLNTKSVTEQSALDEFLTTAELAGTEFVAEKLNISILNVDHSGGLPSKKEEQRIQEMQEQHRQFLQIPRRPKWDEQTTPEQLDQQEKDNFLAWRRSLAELQEKDDLILTPFERNLEFWRQLWRVIERSDVVVQIVDARNPLLFHCEDLVKYVTEVNSHKMNVLLINKADFLTQEQRETWAYYFKSVNIIAVFWSAIFETERLRQKKILEETQSLPLQPQVVEKPEIILTNNHVTQFLNLKEEPDLIEASSQSLSTDLHELDYDGQGDLSGNDTFERDKRKHDHRGSDHRESDLTKSNSTENDPAESEPQKSEVAGSVEGASNDRSGSKTSQNEPRKSEITQNERESTQNEHDITRNEHESTRSKREITRNEHESTQNDATKSQVTRSTTSENEVTLSETMKSYTSGYIESNVQEIDRIKEVPFNEGAHGMLNENQTDQNASTNLQNDIPKINQINLSNECGSEGFKEGSSVKVDLVPESSSEVDGGTTEPLPHGSAALSNARIGNKNVEFYTSGHLLTGDELLAFCQWLHHQYGGQLETGKEDRKLQTVIGLVGYPNVGKSSTINAILQAKKVPVSSTPGRTKHFQTLFVDKTICLCDCPGLVFPSFVSTKAEMVVSGILPIDQLRDHVPPVSLVCRRIPRNVLEAVYGIKLSQPEEWEDQDRPPYAEELLDAYSNNRGYITSQARPEAARSARYILKDYVNGKLLYCHPPPTIEANTFQVSFTADVKSVKKKPPPNSKFENKTHVNKMDTEFFKQENVKFHISATTGTEQFRKLMASRGQSDPNMVMAGKPWKNHGNKNKKEKLRRLKPSGY